MAVNKNSDIKKVIEDLNWLRKEGKNQVSALQMIAPDPEQFAKSLYKDDWEEKLREQLSVAQRDLSSAGSNSFGENDIYSRFVDRVEGEGREVNQEVKKRALIRKTYTPKEKAPETAPEKETFEEKHVREQQETRDRVTAMMNDPAALQKFLAEQAQARNKEKVANQKEEKAKIEEVNSYKESDTKPPHIIAMEKKIQEKEAAEAARKEAQIKKQREETLKADAYELEMRERMDRDYAEHQKMLADQQKEAIPQQIAKAQTESVAKPPEKQFERMISQMQSAQTPKVEDTPRPASPSAMAGQVQGPGPAGSGTGYQWEQNFQPNVMTPTTSQRDMARFDPEIQDLLSRKKKYAQEGLSKGEEEGFRSKMIQSMRQEQKVSGLRAGGALRGMEGASAAAAARRHQQAGQAARGQIEQSVLEKDQAASRAGIEDYMKTLGEVKAFDAGQFEADQMRKMLEDMYNKQLGAAGSGGGGGGGGGSSSNIGQDGIDFVRHTGDETFGEVEKFVDMSADVVGGDFRAIPEYLEELPIIGGATADVVNFVGKPVEKIYDEVDRFAEKQFHSMYKPVNKVIGKAGDLGKKGLKKLSDIVSDLNPFD